MYTPKRSSGAGPDVQRYTHTHSYTRWWREDGNRWHSLQYLSQRKKKETNTINHTGENHDRKQNDTIFLYIFSCTSCYGARKGGRVCCKFTYQCRWRFSIGVIVPRIISRYSPKWRSAHFLFFFGFSEKFINTRAPLFLLEKATHTRTRSGTCEKGWRFCYKRFVWMKSLKPNENE